MNVSNRTIFEGDNLGILRGIDSEVVDLIYLDPPFNSNRNFEAPIGSEAAGAAFKDAWTLSDVDNIWHGEIAEIEPALYSAITAAGETYGKSMKAYLIMMSVRMLEIHRVLKPTGSVYLHCDPTASHYLKTMMDSIFGQRNFRNEIVWFKGYRGTPRKNRYQQEHETIFYYSKTDSYTWNDIFGEYKDPEMKRYNKIDEDGNKYALIKRRRTTGEVYYGKTYPKGKLQGDVVEIPSLASTDSERTGYPTQKPLALLNITIKASSHPGDLVLDPFCGCATTCIAAESLQRQWIGIDISPKAIELLKYRLERELHLTEDTGILGQVLHETAPPQRTDTVEPRQIHFEGLFGKKYESIETRLSEGDLWRFKTHKHVLFGVQEGRCAGCQYLFHFRNITIDHIHPRSKGGSDALKNLQLLCGSCNSIKGDKDQAYLIRRLKEEGILR